jgi:ubiquinone/menaquinone biosynthesis C-methylase UbiE
MEIRTISESQLLNYSESQQNNANEQIQTYASVLRKFTARKHLKIMDLGGGTGWFAMALREYFAGIDCEIFVVDSSEHSTWTEFGDKVKFIKSSAENLKQLFESNSFDLVFADRVFHHFVRDTYKKTRTGQLDIMRQIAYILKSDGNLCIDDMFTDGILWDSAASKLIYMLTSCTFSPIVKFVKKMGAEAAGVGVCFLSKKMWLCMITQAGFSIEFLRENPKGEYISISKKLCLLLKRHSFENILILKKIQFNE